jgi:hypothetical protein
MKIVISRKPLHSSNELLINPDYLNLFGHENGWIYGYENNRICYIVSFFDKRIWFFHYMQMQSGVIEMGSATIDQISFLEAVIAKVKSERVYDFIGQPKTSALYNRCPEGAICAPFGSYIVDLTLDQNILWKNIHSKHKNVIKRAVKNDVTIEFGDNNFKDAYKIIKKTLVRNKMVMIDRQELRSSLKRLNKNSLIGCSYLKGIVQSSVIILYDMNTAYYIWGGTNDKLSLGSNNLLHWQAIKKLKSLGVNNYDFVGARINTKDKKKLGIQRFKKRFGSELRQGYLWKYPVKKWKFLLFSLLYKIRTGKGDLIDQERDSTNL